MKKLIIIALAIGVFCASTKVQAKSPDKMLGLIQLVLQDTAVVTFTDIYNLEYQLMQIKNTSELIALYATCTKTLKEHPDSVKKQKLVFLKKAVLHRITIVNRSLSPRKKKKLQEALLHEIQIKLAQSLKIPPSIYGRGFYLTFHIKSAIL
jgi:hypothetical protein